MTDFVIGMVCFVLMVIGFVRVVKVSYAVFRSLGRPCRCKNPPRNRKVETITVSD